jgi:hypothetical protein
MKNPLVILFLVFCGVSVRAQSVSISDLTNLSTLNITDAHNFLTQGKPFKQLYMQDVNGLSIRHYQGTTPASLKETIIIGDGIKTSSGTLLRTVTYTTTKTKYIINLIAQAPGTGLNKNFQGADMYSNIYVFENMLYTVRIYLKNDDSEGTVEVKQKDFTNF